MGFFTEKTKKLFERGRELKSKIFKKERKIFKRNLEDMIVRTRRMNWDIAFYDDMINNDGILITEPANISLDGKIVKTMNGPNSPLFGTNYEDDQAFAERHRCKCGEFKGRQFDGEICPICHTKVQPRDIDIKKTGWIPLGTNVIINPYFYNIFMRLIGKKIFPEIIMGLEAVDINGQRRPLVPGVDYESKTPFAAIGIDGFLERYDEILDYYAKKRPKHRKELLLCKKEKRKAFTHHIPIYSTALRPSSTTSDTFYFNGIDKQINPICGMAISLKTCEPIEKAYLQGTLQKRVNAMWDYNFELIHKKEGFIRNKLIAGGLNYTSRNVITPDPTLRADEVDIGYQTFRILFKYKIINYLRTIDDIPLSLAFERWEKAAKFDPYVYDIMMYIVKTEQPRILLNRNPTLNYYSMLLMRIRNILPEDNRHILVVPLMILEGLNADFDGDILNIIALFEDEFIHMFRNFDPINKFTISRTTGKMDKKFMLRPGQLIDLYHFYTFEYDESEVEKEVEDPDELLEHVERMKREEETQQMLDKHRFQEDIEFPEVKLPDIEDEDE